ncbi:MAG: BrnA antitoxin family protein [Gammaproteobacteria bacterium]
MRAEYDSSKGKRGALIPTKGKTRITIYIDDAVLNEFRARAERTGAGYQTMMNEALSAFLEKNERPVTAAVLRQIIREELPEVSRLARRSSTGRAKTTRR